MRSLLWECKILWGKALSLSFGLLNVCYTDSTDGAVGLTVGHLVLVENFNSHKIGKNCCSNSQCLSYGCIHILITSIHIANVMFSSLTGRTSLCTHVLYKRHHASSNLLKLSGDTCPLSLNGHEVCTVRAPPLHWEERKKAWNHHLPPGIFWNCAHHGYYTLTQGPCEAVAGCLYGPRLCGELLYLWKHHTLHSNRDIQRDWEGEGGKNGERREAGSWL